MIGNTSKLLYSMHALIYHLSLCLNVIVNHNINFVKFIVLRISIVAFYFIHIWKVSMLFKFEAYIPLLLFFYGEFCFEIVCQGDVGLKLKQAQPQIC